MGPYPALIALILALQDLAHADVPFPSTKGRDSPAKLDVAARLSDYEKSLCQKNDPIAATAFLKDDEARRWLAGNDREKQGLYFKRAALLADYHEALSTYRELKPLSAALRTRLSFDEKPADGCRSLGFGAKPESLLQWGEANVLDFDQPAGEKAVMKWEALSNPQRQWLLKRGRTAKIWRDQSYTVRNEMLQSRALQIYDELFKRVPRSVHEWERMREEGEDIFPSLDDNHRILINERVSQAETALRSLADAEKRAKSLRDPKIHQMLREARSAGTLEESLAALERLFDKLEPASKRLRTIQSPSRKEDFSQAERQVLAPMLAKALLDNIATAPAGAAVVEFYKTHPLTITFKELPGRVGEFHSDDGVIVLNDKLIKTYLKGEGRKIRDVLSDPPLLEKVSMLLSASFIHEATHQAQDAFMKERGVFQIFAQHDEMEAMSVQALFVLEQGKARPAYKKFLEDNQGTYGVCALDLSLGQGLARGPRYYRRSMMNEQYPDVASLEAQTAQWLDRFEESKEILQAELARRAKLSEAERKAVERAGGRNVPEVRSLPPADRMKFLRRLKSEAISAAIEKEEGYKRKSIESYERLRARYDQSMKSVDEGLALYRRGAAPRKKEPGPPAPPKP